jgi:hypothetical protein
VRPVTLPIIKVRVASTPIAHEITPNGMKDFNPLLTDALKSLYSSSFLA